VATKKLVFAKIVIITLVFEKNANLLAENWEISQIVIIASTPDELVTKSPKTKANPTFVKI
jgi:hypothetical protein